MASLHDEPPAAHVSGNSVPAAASHDDAASAVPDRWRKARGRLSERGLGQFAWDAAAWRLRACVSWVLTILDPRTTPTGTLADGSPAGGHPRGLRSRVGRIVLAPFRWGRSVVRKVTLANHRAAAAATWPDAPPHERAVLAFCSAALKFHQPALVWLCTYAPWIRRARGVAAGRMGHVLHVTASFDLGGTQTQIKNLCEQHAGVTQTHEAVELFPEYNYLYRRGCLDRGRYIGRGMITRVIGRLILNPSTRSLQLVQVCKLVRDFRVSRPHIVVGWGHEVSMITFVAAALARVPHIVFCIRTFNPSFGWTTPAMGRLLMAAHRRMMPEVSAVIVNSTPLQQDYAAWVGIDPEGVSVCPNGIDPVAATPAEAAEARERIRAQYEIEPGALLFVHVGRFSAEKGQMSLMQANAALLSQRQTRAFAWLLCGDGVTLPDVRQFVEREGCRNVVFAGRTTDVRSCLMAADVFVMPSDFEGMPNAMMEAMAQGLPSVSTTRSGIVDVARDGIETLYYEPGDVPRLVEHLRYLIEHDHVRREMGQRARIRMQEFTVARAAARIEERLAALSAAPHRT